MSGYINEWSIDIPSGVITQTSFGVALANNEQAAFDAYDVLPLAIKLTAGATDVTTTILTGSEQLIIGLRQKPGQGVLLAGSNSYTMVGGWAMVTLSLNTSEITALMSPLPANALSTGVYLGVDIIPGDDSTRQTIAQLPWTLWQPVNENGDDPPASAAISAGLAATYAAAAEAAAATPLQNLVALVGIASAGADATRLAGLTTAGGAVAPGAIVIGVFTVNSLPVMAYFRLRAGTDAASYPFVTRPFDYNASTNALVWDLMAVAVNGLPALWNPTTSLFHYIEAAGASGSVALAIDQTGFALPA